MIWEHMDNKLVFPTELWDVFHIHPSWKSASAVKAHGFLMALRIRAFPLKGFELFIPCFNTTAVVSEIILLKEYAYIIYLKLTENITKIGSGYWISQYA